MTRTPLWCSASLMALALAPPLAAQDAEKTVLLRAGPLPIDGQALTPACVRQRGGEMNLTRGTGVVTPPEKAEIKKDGQATLCGVKVDFHALNGEVSLIGPNGKPVRLAKRGEGVEAIPVPLANKRMAVVAIPIVDVNKAGASLFFRAAMSMGGQIDGDSIALYDDDLDGTFSTGKDAFSVGSGIVFASLGQWLPTSKGLFRIGAVDETGAKLTCQAASESTGRLDLKYASPFAEAHVVFGGKDVEAVLTGRKPMTVLAGSYQLRYGLLVNPASRATYAGIVAGSLPAVEVPSGGDKPATVAMGGPYRLDFKVTAPKRKVTIDPGTFRLFGKGEERYVDYRIKGNPVVSVNGKSLGSFEYG